MADNSFIGAMGWLMDEERREELAATQTDAEIPMMGEPPEEIDPRGFHQVENQANQGACQGHDISSCVEHCYHIAAGEVKQFSRAHGYYGTQRIDGIRGDRGSTISGGVTLAKRGIVLESVWPYPSQYDPTPPMPWDELDKLAEAFQIQTHKVLKSYADMFNWLATGQGAISTGTTWGFNPSADGVVDRWTNPGGGHATAVLGYSKRKDDQGRHYTWLLNSWSKRWGNQGWAEIAPSVWDTVFARDGNAVIIGISDLKTPVVRPISWAKNHGI